MVCDGYELREVRGRTCYPLMTTLLIGTFRGAPFGWNGSGLVTVIDFCLKHSLVLLEMDGTSVEVNMNDQMDCTSSLLGRHERPECTDSSTEPKRQRLDDDVDGRLAKNADRSERLTQLKKDIAVLEAAVRRGKETMEKMLNIASRQEDLLRRRRSLMAELVSVQNAAEKRNRVERLQNGSLVVNLLEDIGDNNDSSFIKVEAWELKKCGCDFCGVYNSSRVELPPRV
uniref:Uncharacterized protein n=1 Tax=Setaria digitata TaxID=48799 RepID=A0A915PTJ4_9BILA